MHARLCLGFATLLTCLDVGAGGHPHVGRLWGQGEQAAANQDSLASRCRVHVQLHAHGQFSKHYSPDLACLSFATQRQQSSQLVSAPLTYASHPVDTQAQSAQRSAAAIAMLS